MSNFFDDLMASTQQMNATLVGERQPSREFTVDATEVKEGRHAGFAVSATLAESVAD